MEAIEKAGVAFTIIKSTWPPTPVVVLIVALKPALNAVPVSVGVAFAEPLTVPTQSSNRYVPAASAEPEMFTVIVLLFNTRLEDAPVTLILPRLLLTPPTVWKDNKAEEASVTDLDGALMVAAPEVLLPESVCCGLEPVKVKPDTAKPEMSNVAPALMASTGDLEIAPLLLKASVPLMIVVLPA